MAAARAARETGGWDEYRVLLGRAGADGVGALRGGLELIGSGGVFEREVGCDLLGEASERHEAVRGETAGALAALAERETERCVLRSLARAIGSTGDARAVPVLVALAGHPDAGVRQEVASSFTGVITGRPDGADVRALTALTRDEDPEVRSWATFVLGFQAEVDGPAIRAALWERTADDHADAREEGIRGLARRHDPRAVPLLVELLGNPQGAHVHTFAAAQIMGVPELLPSLLAYEPDAAGVTAAVRACDPVARAHLEASAGELISALYRLRPRLDAALYRELFGPDLTLGLFGTAGSSSYDVEALLARADGDPSRAAQLVMRDADRSR
ncbi:HEAT repeat domain-containing protein [Streptomyces sp. ISL-66]|uniref:HEAT repeat domain-containing protein n=1 Tax=Streptomyces sp. ISL-66 TaxID=2819186 RepID=UPI001BE518A6|nr:HEAT repeat domain-containing protein [Streptomyces sp. ISL-66]MBT2472751.1 HEAT repeat domain-containing protein [Streptomyces sp. ISL-66]